MLCRYYTIQVHGQVLTIIECPFCNELTQVHAMRPNKVHPCPECGQHYVEPAHAHFKEATDTKFYILE